VRRLLLLLGLAVVSGCGDDGGIEGVPWALESGASATFADGTVTGSTGCNRFTAPYTLDGEKLEIGHVAATQMACPPPADKIERDYLAALDRVAAWDRTGDELVLSDAAGKELLRFRVLSIEGAWTATSFLQGDAVSSTLLGTEVTAEFGKDGKLTGSAGCNTYHGRYKAENGAISIDALSATEMACTGPPGVMEQEQAYLSALPRAVKYTVEGSRLSLLTEHDTFVATYERAP
jgi:heat shock protein HslJ